GAEVGNAFAADIAEHPGRERRSGVLDPPLAVAVAGQLVDGTGRNQPHAAGRQDDTAELRGPALRVALYGEIERRLAKVRGGDAGSGLLAVGQGPTLAEPCRCIEAGVEAGKQSLALACHAAEHRVGEALEV